MQMSVACEEHGRLSGMLRRSHARVGCYLQSIIDGLLWALNKRDEQLEETQRQARELQEENARLTASLHTSR